MADLICDTSPVQYLHQLRLFGILPRLSHKVLLPDAVIQELDKGRLQGIDLPETGSISWITEIPPNESIGHEVFPELGPGEAEVLALALRSKDAIAVLDDLEARSVALMYDIRLTGTLELLLEAKQKRLIDDLTPLLDKLQGLRFRLSQQTRLDILQASKEAK